MSAARRYWWACLCLILLGWPVGFGLLWYRTEVWLTIAGWVTAGIALAAAIFAFNQVQEARRTRERQTQPNVVAFADLHPGESDWLDVIVKNFGQTAAYRVRLDFDPWPTVMPWIDPRTGDTVTHCHTRRDTGVSARPGVADSVDTGEERAKARLAAKPFSKRRGSFTLASRRHCQTTSGCASKGT